MTKKIAGQLPNWEAGLCRTMDPEIFFADDQLIDANPTALAACNRCLISSECLNWAMMNDERFGVWGGLTPKQRRAAKRPIIRLRCPGCQSEAILEESASETCLSCGLSWRI